MSFEEIVDGRTDRLMDDRQILITLCSGELKLEEQEP